MIILSKNAVFDIHSHMLDLLRNGDLNDKQTEEYTNILKLLDNVPNVCVVTLTRKRHE